MIFPDADAVTAALIAQKIDVLILDPFVKTHGVSENDNGEIERVARKLNDIAEAADCSVEAPQHIREASNLGRTEVTADDGRGAGSLKDAARCIRVMNRMTPAEAIDAQVKEKDRKRYFRIDDDGKANMTAPAEAATWFKLVSVPLENEVAHPGAHGDEIGVVTSWQSPVHRQTRSRGSKPTSTLEAHGQMTLKLAIGQATQSHARSKSTQQRNPAKPASRHC